GGRQAGRAAGPAVHQARADHQPADRQDARAYFPAAADRPRRRGDRMNRRELISLIGGAAASSPLWPRAARAQRGRRMPRVGVLWHAGSAEEEAIYLGAFVQGLNGLGYVDRRTIVLEHRFPNETPERFVSLANELAALDIDVLVAVTRPAALAAQRATSTIPIVFIVVPDPVGTKLVDSLAHPGGNITGFTHIAVELSAKRLALF